MRDRVYVLYPIGSQMWNDRNNIYVRYVSYITNKKMVNGTVAQFREYDQRSGVNIDRHAYETLSRPKLGRSGVLILSPQ